ncbi:MAG: hypothetical protein EP299_02730 [Acidobacteria bacterium]|nr:MAG: hypothetical protein EP299_02730 [Acidobacteriota bacterium]
MDRPLLIIGNRNCSSWSLRAWFALEVTGLAYNEVMVPLGRPDASATILRSSPTASVTENYELGQPVPVDEWRPCERGSRVADGR